MRKIAIIELGGVRGKKLTKLYEQARGEAFRELAAYKKNLLFVAGLMLYFGEGDKTTKHQVRLSHKALPGLSGDCLWGREGKDTHPARGIPRYRPGFK